MQSKKHIYLISNELDIDEQMEEVNSYSILPTTINMNLGPGNKPHLES